MHVFSSLTSLYTTLEASLLLSLRFFLFAGVIFLFLYVWKRDKYWFAKIQQLYPGNKNIWHEIKYSFFTVVVFGIVLIQVMWASKNRWTLIYYPIDKYGYGYWAFSILLMIVIHDAYFYWTHRFLHWKPIFKMVHKVHHHSLNPTPFASYCFHPFEALVEIGIIPLLVFTVPYHVSAICAFSVYTLVLNVIGHTGYEFLPRGFTTHKIFKWHNSATHHNMHHKFIKCNYGLYFNFWDRVMKTNHPKYDQYYEGVIDQREIDKITLDTGIVKAKETSNS
jgi:lathosterol oxidase